MTRHFLLVLGAATLALCAVSPSVAQTAATIDDDPIACPSQQELEQAVGSAGEIRPDECTTIEISKLSSDGMDLCLIDFGIDEGFLGRLRDVAMPSQWWVRCDDLENALQ